MELEFILHLIEENGYIGLFLWLWFGIFGLPIPNEVLVMTVGLAAAGHVLNPYFTFLVLLGGIYAALTTCYLLGRFVGRPILGFFEKSKRLSRTIDSSLNMMDKHHAFSLSLSYFIPGIRNFVPFLYGFSKLPFRTFILFAYSGATVWLMIMFTVGYAFGDHIHVLNHYEKEILFYGGLFLVAYFFMKAMRKKRKRKLEAVKERGASL